MYKEGQVLLRPLGSPEPDPARPGDARVDYDVPHAKPWGLDMAFYLLTKGIGTGAMFLSALLWVLGVRTPLTMVAGPAIGLVFVDDHRRRFLFSISSGPSASSTSCSGRTGDRGWCGARTS